MTPTPQQIAAKLTEAQQRLHDVRCVIAGYFHLPATNVQKCQHGHFGFDDCVACYDIAIRAALDGEPQAETIAGRSHIAREGGE